MQQDIKTIFSSYRDPSGFVFEKEGVLYRQVNLVAREDFDKLISSGCYDHLVKEKLLVPHEEVDTNLTGTSGYYKTLRPKRIPFISYAYEWCFDMLRDAALLTLDLVKQAMPFGMMLKDASPYNVQWSEGRPVFIDTLSFERYEAARPWIAYRQFCENFLSPLLLMHYSGEPMQTLLLAYPEGIPLTLTKSLLPNRSRFSVHTYLHIHLHARLAAQSAGTNINHSKDFSEKKLSNLIQSLHDLISSLKWKGSPTAWEDYYTEAGERGNYLPSKKIMVEEWIREIPPAGKILDLGANKGEFSFLAARADTSVVATDFDHSAINLLYHAIKAAGQQNILPLVIDFSHPSPAIGVNNKERDSFLQRAPADLCLALALIHHLAIGKNIPFDMIVSTLYQLASYVIIEFVPKEDEKVQFMMRQKKDIYQDYTEANFIKALVKHFSVLKKQEISQSGRSLFLIKRNG